MAQFWTLSFACQRKRLAGRIFRPCFFAVHVSIFVCLWISIFTSWTILWGKIVWSVCLQNKTTMAESYPLSGQYSPDHRNPYRTNEAFHFDPDEEEKLAGHLEGIITRFLAQSFYLKLGRQYVCGLFWKRCEISWRNESCGSIWDLCVSANYTTCTCIKVQVSYL